MRRASLLVAVASVSMVLVSACEAFPDLTEEQAGLESDGSVSTSAGGDGSGSGSGQGGSSGGGGSTGTSGDGSSSAKSDASSGDDAAAKSDSSAPTKDSGTPDTGTPVIDSGNPLCTAQTVDCSVAETSGCPQCSACTGKCGGLTLQPVCCVTRSGNSDTYKQCCEGLGGPGNMMTCSMACN